MDNSFLTEQLIKNDVSNHIKVLLCIHYLGGSANTTAIREIAVNNGATNFVKLNLSHYLRILASRSMVSKHANQWKIRNAGNDQLISNELLPSKPNEEPTFVDTVISTVQEQSDLITDPLQKLFFEEVISCLSVGSYRAAAIMMWVGSLHILQDKALSEKANELQATSSKRLTTPKKFHAGIKKIDDFEEVKESVQVQIFHDAGLIGKTLKNQLVERLNFRNACGHPNSVAVTKGVACSHVEFLAANVFTKN